MLNSESIKNFFISCWYGNEKLWKAFWLLGFLTFFIAVLFAVVLKSREAYLIFGFLIQLPMTIFWLISTWRCAPNSKIIFKYFARGIVILITFNFVSKVTQTFI